MAILEKIIQKLTNPLRKLDAHEIEREHLHDRIISCLEDIFCQKLAQQTEHGYSEEDLHHMLQEILDQKPDLTTWYFDSSLSEIQIENEDWKHFDERTRRLLLGYSKYLIPLDEATELTDLERSSGLVEKFLQQHFALSEPEIEHVFKRLIYSDAVSEIKLPDLR